MSGPEHYRMAEKLLTAAMDQSAPGQQLSDRAREFSVQQAQVHATLALAAASVAVRDVSPQQLSGYHVISVDGWEEALA